MSTPTIPGSSEQILGGPSLRGRRFALEPFTPDHHRALYQLITHEQINFRWRFRGAIPPYELFLQNLNAGVLQQFVVTVLGQPDALVGFVVAYNASPQDGTCYLGAVMAPEFRVGGLESIGLFLRHLFSVWPFRKIYLEAPEYNVAAFASGIRMGLLKEEARFRENEFFAGRYWDRFVFAIYRGDAERFSESYPTLFVQEVTALETD